MNEFSNFYDSSQILREEFIGIHLAGPNSSKSAIVIIHKQGKKSLISDIHFKIGSLGRTFSDERMIQILESLNPTSVLVDTPLTSTPCNMCSRDLCPGVLKCEDVAVAYMLKLSEQVRHKSRRKKVVVNPLNQRLWDYVVSMQEPFNEEQIEPSYNSGKLALVARAKVFFRRLKESIPDLHLRETSVSHALFLYGQAYPELAEAAKQYKNFINGLDARTKLVRSFVNEGFLAKETDAKYFELIVRYVEVFQSFVCALVAALPPYDIEASDHDIFLSQGWVCLPQFE